MITNAHLLVAFAAVLVLLYLDLVKGNHMSKALDDLKSAVQSAVTKITTLTAEVAAGTAQSAALQAQVTTLTAEVARLTAEAGTPDAELVPLTAELIATPDKPATPATP